jgi:oligosaccharyltransferase complex subunit alpha (ribophorin I)
VLSSLLQLPFPDIQQSWDKKFTYLDTAGRPVLVLSKSNVVPEQNKPFAVDYSFTFTGMMREPLLLISGAPLLLLLLPHVDVCCLAC